MRNFYNENTIDPIELRDEFEKYLKLAELGPWAVANKMSMDTRTLDAYRKDPAMSLHRTVVKIHAWINKEKEKYKTLLF